MKKLDSLEGNSCANLVETALDVEYSAFELYRSIAESLEDEKARAAIADIAQAEKDHMRILIDALADCATASPVSS